MSITDRVRRWIGKKVTPKCPAVKGRPYRSPFFETSTVSSGIHPAYDPVYKRSIILETELDTKTDVYKVKTSELENEKEGQDEE